MSLKTLSAYTYIENEVKRENPVENNDCVVISFAKVMGVTYKQSYRLFEHFGRKPNKGVSAYLIFTQYLSNYFTPIRFEKRFTLRKFFEIFVIDDYFLITTYKHMCCGKKKMLFDWIKPSPNERIKLIYIIKKRMTEEDIEKILNEDPMKKLREALN